MFPFSFRGNGLETPTVLRFLFPSSKAWKQETVKSFIMNNYKYVLEPYKGSGSKYRCPACRQRTFVRYIDTSTGEHLGEEVGRCDREVRCGYHLPPKAPGEKTSYRFCLGASATGFRTVSPTSSMKKTFSCIQEEVVSQSLNHYEQNNLVQFLAKRIGYDMAIAAAQRYLVGTSKHWPGATVFWQRDTKGRVRTGKIILYNPHTGKRVKDPTPFIAWAHTTLKLPGFQLEQCLFGEHLLNTSPQAPVALVESEKTAVIASVYLPEFIWLAAGGLSAFSAERCRVLKGRKVVLFPDLGGFDRWKAKAKELSLIAAVTVSDLLEKGANKEEREQGLDLADYLVQFPLSEFVPDTLHLDSQAIVNLHGLCKTSIEGLQIHGFETLDGKFYDILTDADEVFIAPGQNEIAVAQLSALYTKQFQPGSIDGVPCLLRLDKFNRVGL